MTTTPTFYSDTCMLGTNFKNPGLDHDKIPQLPSVWLQWKLMVMDET